MRWTILLRQEGADSADTEVSVATIERGQLPATSELGLMHQEGKRLLHCLQEVLVKQQCQAYFAACRTCHNCGAHRSIKDYRSRHLQTVYGKVRLRLPRFLPCRCNHLGQPSWYGSDLMPERSTPEWIAMQSSLGARIPFREAAFLLSAFLPVERRLNHGTVRNHTVRLGGRITLEETAAGPEGLGAQAINSGSLAIDGTCVKGNRREGLSKLHVVVGSLKYQSKGASAFAFIQQYKPQPDLLRSMWQHLGCHVSTSLRVVTDGDTGLHRMVKISFPGKTTHILDWFHIAMRLNAIERSIAYGLWRAKQPQPIIDSVQREMESIHHHLWHGDHDLACGWLGALVNRLEWTVDTEHLDRFSPLQSTLDKMTDLRKYLMRFQEEVISYSIAHRAHEPVSTAPVESLINRLVNHRMNKSQQMRWSIRGAQTLLQVRVALLNGSLPKILKRMYPGFSNSRITELPGQLAAA